MFLKLASNFAGSMSYVSGLYRKRLLPLLQSKQLEEIAASLFHRVNGLDLVARGAETVVAIRKVVAVPAHGHFYVMKRIPQVHYGSPSSSSCTHHRTADSHLHS